MTRDTTTEFKAELTATSIQPVLLSEVYFFDDSSGSPPSQETPIRLWSGIGDLSWDSKTWQGVGDLLKVEPSAETEEITPSSIRLTLGGIKSSFISLALQSTRQGKRVNVWFGFIDSSTGLIVSDPLGIYLLFNGRVDTIEIEEGPEGAIITLSAENRLTDLGRKRERRYTPEDQKSQFPNDKGLETVHAAAVWSGNWGAR
ncbi:hypothetical protein LCGC14_1913400 [marine sediment metagenome]|uniref:Uncharacterized protein n=1 Tax=marine sediment metagenome TaxID=412755 RepID=A0A0F9FTJ8_9ZZZZ